MFALHVNLYTPQKQMLFWKAPWSDPQRHHKLSSWQWYQLNSSETTLIILNLSETTGSRIDELIKQKEYVGRQTVKTAIFYLWDKNVIIILLNKKIILDPIDSSLAEFRNLNNLLVSFLFSVPHVWRSLEEEQATRNFFNLADLI